MCLVVACAGAAGLIGGLVTTHSAKHGYFLWGLFLITGFIQYYYNSQFTDSVAAPLEVPVELPMTE